MGWNGSSSAGQPANGRAASTKPPQKNSPSLLRGILAGVLICAALAAALYVVLSGDRPAQSNNPTIKHSNNKIKEVTPAPAPKEESRKEKSKRIRAEMNDLVKPFIKAATTNNVRWVIPPLDPNDPDNALRTSLARDISTLLSIRPGEEIPPCIPFDFMFEDDAIAAQAARGEKIVTTDGGNKLFLENLKKWKITIKEGDSDAKIAAKNELVEAQIELLKGIDEGISVNDSIREAYNYRIKAAEMRKDMMKTIKDIHTDDPDVATTRALLKKANEQLAAEGIIPIGEESVIPEDDLIAADGESGAPEADGQADDQTQTKKEEEK